MSKMKGHRLPRIAQSWRLQHPTARLSRNSSAIPKSSVFPCSSSCSVLKFALASYDFYFCSSATAHTVSTVRWRKWIRTRAQSRTPVKTVCTCGHAIIKLVFIAIFITVFKELLILYSLWQHIYQELLILRIQ